MANGEDVQGIPREVGLLDRPGQAAQSLFTGNLPAAWRSMFQPGDLSIPERDSLLKKLGLDKPPFDVIFRTLTNPLLIISLALSHKFPIPAGANIFKLSEKVGSLTSRFPILGRFTSMQALFRGTSLPDDIGEVVRLKHDYLRRHFLNFDAMLQKFQAISGGKLPTQRQQIMVSAWLDGLHKGVRGFEGVNGRIRIGSGSTTAVLPGVKALFPNLESQMGRPLLELAKDTRKILDDQWTEAFTNVEGRKRILEAIRRQKGQGISDDVSDVMNEFIKNPKKIADYFPHRVLQTEEDFKAMIAALTEAASSKKFARSAARKSLSFAGPEVHKRKLGMTPATEDLTIIEDLMSGTEKAKLDAVIKAKLIHKARVGGMNGRSVNRLNSIPLKQLLDDYPKTLQPGEAEVFSRIIAEHMPSEYSLKLMPVLKSYSNTLSSTFAWTIKGMGEKITGQLQKLKDIVKTTGNPQAKARIDMLENTYIPIAMGRGTFRQSLKAQSWDHSMIQLGAFMEEPKIKKFLGESLTKTLQNGIAGSRNALSFSNISRKTAGYFYLSTLGLNPGAALKNTLQLVLTTGPTIGYRTTVAGLNRAFQKSHKYFALRLGPRAMKHEEALIKAYPEFGKAGLAAAPITDEVISNTLLNAYNIGSLPSGATKTSEKIQRAMMSVFTASETTVRLATFEAGMIHAQRARMGVDQSIMFAKKLVEQTQFLTGPQNTPFFLLDKAATTRQLLQFPFRFLEFATSTAFTLGSGALGKDGKPMNILGRWNPGTFARMIAGSIIAMELGESIGVNAGDALLGGALPTFTPLGKVGAPLPVIPPLFQILGAGAAGLASGDFTELMRSTPLLIPGGVELFKVMGFIPPGVPGSEMGQRAAQIFEKNYADYKQPAPDGRIAVFSGKGTLRGYYTPWEIVRYSLGVRGGDLDKEQETLNFLIKNRENIREEKAAYLDARFRNDAREANEISRAFKTRFGFEIPTSEDDMRAMQLRRRITRLEQVVRTLPPGPAREQMIQAIAVTLGAEGQTLLGIDPLILGAPKSQREAGRFGGGSTATRFRARTDLSPNDQINPATIGRQPGTNVTQSPF